MAVHQHDVGMGLTEEGYRFFAVLRECHLMTFGSEDRLDESPIHPRCGLRSALTAFADALLERQEQSVARSLADIEHLFEAVLIAEVRVWHFGPRR